ncbi:MAG: hypothetical protein PGN11_03305 [Quadrisphaera sp.]
MSDADVTAQRLSPAGPPPRAGAWMAVTALVCGAVALLLCWIPLVNLLAIVAGLGGLVFGVLALVLARRGLHRGPRRAALGTAASALALVVALVVDVVYVVQLGDRLVTTAAPPARPAPSAAAPSSSSSGDAPSTTPSAQPSTSASPPASAPAQATTGLPLGTVATVGDYTVTITGVTTNADAAIAEANQFNQPPTGRYVLADVSVVYNGTEEGIPWAQLQPAFQGTDARNYSWSSCTATVPRPGFQQPTLRTGGASEYQVCFDLPAEAIAGGAVEVKGLLPGTSATWSVPG